MPEISCFPKHWSLLEAGLTFIRQNIFSNKSQTYIYGVEAMHGKQEKNRFSTMSKMYLNKKHKEVCVHPNINHCIDPPLLNNFLVPFPCYIL